MCFGVLNKYSFTQGVALFFKLLGGSVKIHRKMLLGIIGSPMAFFDETPSGWILNRFSKDLDISESRYYVI